jgi:hypothetical protein
MPLRVSFVLNEEPIAKLWAKKKGENGLKGAARAQTAPQGRLMDNLGLLYFDSNKTNTGKRQ